VSDAICAGIFNDLGSGSNVDVCVITKVRVFCFYFIVPGPNPGPDPLERNQSNKHLQNFRGDIGLSHLQHKQRRPKQTFQANVEQELILPDAFSISLTEIGKTLQNMCCLL